MAQITTPSKEGNPRSASVRMEADHQTGYAAQRRHDLRIGHQPGYVDSDRLNLNRILIAPPSPCAMRKIAEERRARQPMKRAMKKNAAIATAGIITFGSEAAQMFETLSPEEQDRAFRLLARAVSLRLRTSLHGLVVHRDEATIHCHITLAAHTRDGIPLSKATRPAIMSGLQDLAAQVLQRFCSEIERGHRYGDRVAAGARWSDVIHKSVRELHRDLPRDLAAKRAALAGLTRLEVEAAERVVDLQDRMADLTKTVELKGKEVTHLETLRSGLFVRMTELKAIQAASEAARVEAARLADIAIADRQREEARAKESRAKVNAVTDAISSLSEEVAAKTIKRTPDGNIAVASPERLRSAFSEIQPVIVAAADHVACIDAAEAANAAEREEIDNYMREVAQRGRRLNAVMAENMSLRETLKSTITQLGSWAKKFGITTDMRSAFMLDLRTGVDLVKRADELQTEQTLEEPSTPGRPE